MTDFDQGCFNFEAKGDESGYQRWQEELDARKRAFETRWGVILGRRVQLELRDHKRPLTGIIHLTPDPTRPAGESQPIFRIGSIPFSPSEIESLVALDR